MNELKAQIKKANDAYRVGNPIISDEEYDILLSKLEDQTGFVEFEDFKATLTESTGTVKLNYVLGSLSKFKYEESDLLDKWMVKHKLKSIFASLKIDGCSFNASWRKGILVMCSSRGDGDTGTDWTEKAKHILPVTIPYLDDLDIRGEFTLCDDSHVILGYKNRRNGTVGIMNKDIIEPEKLKYVKAICYEVLSGDMNIYEQFKFLHKEGFITPPRAIYDKPTDLYMLHETLKAYYLDRKPKAPYDIDGLVISSPHYKRENVFFPEAKVAFKINSEGVHAKVLGIEWNISKGGLLKPVVLIEPTEITGSTVQRVTGFNAQYILDNGIKIGTIVSIVKSGEVIPKIVKVINP